MALPAGVAGVYGRRSVIEYLLLVGLGFLAAALLALIIAPAIQRRIVIYAENRLRATMPLTPQEVRAQRDMARAAFAAEHARTEQELIKEREKRLNLQIAQDKVARDAAAMRADNEEMRVALEELQTELGHLRSALRKDDSELSRLHIKVSELDAEIASRDAKIAELNQHINRLGGERDNLKIDMAARNTQFENDRYRIQTLREERDELRHEVKLLKNRAKEAEQRLAQEEHKTLRLSDKLEREQASLADRDMLIERRTEEINRLREKVKTLSAENRKATRQGGEDRKSPGKPAAMAVVQDSRISISGETMDNSRLQDADIPALKDELRHRSAALSEQLMKQRVPGQDARLREELSDIAARMVALTALEEGDASPIRDLLKASEKKDTGPHPSLAERVQGLLPEERAR